MPPTPSLAMPKPTNRSDSFRQGIIRASMEKNVIHCTHRPRLIQNRRSLDLRIHRHAGMQAQ